LLEQGTDSDDDNDDDDDDDDNADDDVENGVDGPGKKSACDNRRPSAVQAEKKNFREAQALYPRGVFNRMMKTAYLTSEVRRLRRHGDVTPDVQVCKRRRSSQPLQSAGRGIHMGKAIISIFKCMLT
jgi:hypothetical protein